KLVNAKIHHIVLSGDNSDAINSDLIRCVIGGEFRAVFMSPEIIFGDSPTSKLVQGLWHNTHWQSLLLAIVVDEVHCIEKWGDKFRPEYARLGELRIWSPDVPFVGVTATLTADALSQTMDKLFLSKANVIRVQEIPTNVRLEVHTQPKDAKKGLNRLVGNDKTIIYFEKISILIDVFKYISRTRPDLRGRLGVYFSTLTSQYKEVAMTKFVEGDIHILLATEAAGMAFQGTYRAWFSDLDEQHEIPKSKALESFMHHQSPKRPPQKKTWGSETWILPDNVAKQLSQKFSGARTAKAVKAIASSCKWTPLGENRFDEVAQVLDKLNNDIDAHRGSGSQTTVTYVLDQLQDSSDGDRERSDGETNLLES
ncbi:ATP-dependent DNA helicase sgs1, partial [Podila epicladia]